MRADIDPHPFTEECAPVPPEVFIGTLLRAGFSPEAYRHHNGDLRRPDWGVTELLAHYLRHGVQERRAAPAILDPHALLELARLPIRDRERRAHLLTMLCRSLFGGVKQPAAAAIVERWPLIRDLASEGARRFFVTGDSHSEQLAPSGARGDQWLLPILMLCTAGSARGLGNPESKSGYGQYLQQAMTAIAALPGALDVPILIQFGQVDIEFVHHFQRVRDGRHALDLDEYRQFCATTVERYIGFLTMLFPPERRASVFVFSVFPPVLSDDAWRAGEVNGDIVWRETEIPRNLLQLGLTRLHIADLRQRTGIHTHYNDLLRNACEQHSFHFIDVFTPFLGPDGLADLRYVVPEARGREHHLDSRQSYIVLATVVWAIMDWLAASRAAAS